ncbi:cytochrome c [Neobacillus drentensis]|uniref:c-type cytochrome n=1 Tax=Neobacillus drentensis TaxID=220684 RepID=UPI002FFE34D0
MKKLTIGALFFLLFALISACSNETGFKEETAKETTTTTTAEVKGDEVFQKSCITCHSSGDITGGQIKLDSTKIHTDFKTEANLANFVKTNMPKSAPGSLSKEEYDAVVKYLWDQK